MAGLAGLMTAAARLATLAGRAGNRTRAKIAKLGDLLHDLVAALLEIGKGKEHIVASKFPAYYIRKDFGRKKKPLHPLTSASHTRELRAH